MTENRDHSWGNCFAPAVTKSILKAMKITTILLTVFCLQVSAGSVAQVSFSGKDVALEKVFAAIRKQSDFRIFFDRADLRDTRPVTVEAKAISVLALLDIVIKDQPIYYKLVGRNIFIGRKQEEEDKSQNSDKILENQEQGLITIKGKLLNQKNEPVEGATIQVKGSTKATTSDAKGEFTLTDIDEKSVLIVSSVNYQRQEIRVNGKSEIIAKLDIRSMDLAEVNVTVSTGFQEVEQSNMSGSIVQIDNKLFNRRVSGDVLSRLEGVANGLLFDKSSGNSLGISVRGRSTIFANTQPLIVLDNFPFNGDINSINPNDIESVTILKDAAAAAIWGAYSGNGVIVVTTKKGKYGQPVKVEINSNVTITEIPDLFYDKQFISSKSYIDVESYLFGKGFYNNDINDQFSRPVLSPVVELLVQKRNGQIDEESFAREIETLKGRDVRSEYEKHLYRKAISQQYSLALSGGNAKVNYYLSGGYNKDLSNIRNNDNKRITLNSMLAYKPIERLELSARIAYSSQDANNNGIASVSPGGNYSAAYPYTALANENGVPLPINKTYRSTFVENPGVNGLLDWTYFPLKELNYSDNKANTTDLRLLGSFKYKILKGLSVDFIYQHQKLTLLTKNNKSIKSFEVRDFINRFSEVVNNTVSQRYIPIGNILLQSTNNTTTNSYRTQINFSRDINEFSITSILGTDILETITDGYRSGIFGYDENTGASKSVNYDTRYITFPAGTRSYIPDYNGISPKTVNRFRAFYWNGGLTFRNKYIISGSARVDQSNLFGVKTNQKSVPLWSIGGKWNVNEEPFWSVSWIPALKLRVTYGENGNLDRTITALTTARLNSGGINNDNYFEIVSPGNPQLKWEKSNILNFAMDFELFKKSIITGTLELYYKKGNNLIGDRIIPSSTGFQLARGNFSNMKGSGIDLTLSSNLSMGKVYWQSNLLFSYTRDEITRNEGNTGKLVGKPVNAILTYQWGGLDKIGDPQGYLDGKLSKEYNKIASAVVKDPTLYYYSGSGTPRIFGAFRNSFSFKNFALSANITYKLSYYFIRNSIQYNSLYRNGVGHQDYEKRWQNPGDELKTNTPSQVYINYPQFVSRDNFYSRSTALVEKGDHIRLQDVNLTYTAVFLKKRVSPVNVQFYLYANNLGIIWKENEQGIDPDYRTGYYNPKSFSFGARISL